MPQAPTALPPTAPTPSMARCRPPSRAILESATGSVCGYHQRRGWDMWPSTISSILPSAVYWVNLVYGWVGHTGTCHATSAVSLRQSIMRATPPHSSCGVTALTTAASSRSSSLGQHAISFSRSSRCTQLLHPRPPLPPLHVCPLLHPIDHALHRVSRRHQSKVNHSSSCLLASQHRHHPSLAVHC